MGGTLVTPAPAMTIEEYLRTPESVLPQELVYGHWRAADAPTPRHQSAVFALALALNRFARTTQSGRIYLAPVDVILDREQHLIVQPDLLFIARERLHMVSDRIWGAPDLTLEVLSPKPRIGDLRERLGWFAKYGVRECWVLHQDQNALDVIEFAGGAERTRRRYTGFEPIASSVLPGFSGSVDAILLDYDQT
jgi:Uma2 family endonuclease